MVYVIFLVFEARAAELTSEGQMLSKMRLEGLRGGKFLETEDAGCWCQSNFVDFRQMPLKRRFRLESFRATFNAAFVIVRRIFRVLFQF